MPGPKIALALLILTAAAHAQTQATFAVDDFATGRSAIRLRAVAPRPAAPSAKPAATSSTAQCDTTGPQNIAVLAVTTPANPALPSDWNNSAIQQAWFATSGLSLNTYWQDASYGQTSATGQVFGPFALGSNYDCSNLDNLAAAAIAAAGSSVNFSQYSRIAIVFPVQSCTLPDFGNIGGYGSIGCYPQSPLTQDVSVAWFPIFPTWSTPANSVGIVAHEHGHNLGLHHGNTEDFGPVPLGAPDVTGINTEYGDPFSVMGNADILSTLPTFGQYSAEQKVLLLNWLSQPDYLEVTAPGAFTLAPYESGSGLRALRVLRDPVAGSWLWIEFRQPVGTVDTTLSNLSGANASNVFNGALIHYENPELDPIHTYLLDYQPSVSPNNFHTAALTAGQTWSDPDSLLKLTVNSTSAAGLTVTASWDTACAAVALSGSTVTVTAPSSCAWTASTSTSWITFNGPVSGAGNAAIPFTLAANTTANQRLGFITVNRQSLSVLQPGTTLSIAGITPTVNSGSSGRLSVGITDALGASDVAAAYITVFGAPACTVTVYPSQAQKFALTADSGTTLLGPTTSGTLSNSECSLDGSSSSVTEQGSQVTVNLALSFTAAYAGSHHITAIGQTQAGTTASLTMGTWTVPSPSTPSLTSIGPAQAVVGGSAFTLSATGTNFVSGETLQWNGTALPTVFVNSTEITATVSSNLIAALGSATVNVSGASGSQTFAVVAASPAIASLSPASVAAGSAAQTLTVTGTGFVNTTAVLWNGTALSTTFVSATQLTAAVPATLLATAGTATVTVSGGSGSQTFTIAVVPPSINPGGIVPVGSSSSVIAPNSWISLYGAGLSNGIFQWDGSYPTTLGGVSVTIDGKPAFLSYVSPGQINVLSPDDSAQGVVPVVVTTPGGTVQTTVTLAPIVPAFIPFGATHYAVSIIPTTGGNYTVGSAANPIPPGQEIELFGVGFGPTSPAVPAGTPFSGAASTTNKVTVTVGGVPAEVPFAGIILGGLYQINIVIPQVAAGDQLIQAYVGGAQTPTGVYLPVGP